MASATQDALADAARFLMVVPNEHRKAVLDRIALLQQHGIWELYFSEFMVEQGEAWIEKALAP